MLGCALFYKQGYKYKDIKKIFRKSFFFLKFFLVILLFKVSTAEQIK